ncbi:MAG: efflux RND transporter periplasmic adaptor subunit, partial [Pirellulaceae bacterium]
STVLFNGNPLLRFDGYYILADVMEVPNLQQKSTQALTGLVKKHMLGFEKTHHQMMPTRNLGGFALYAIASILYRWFIVIVILIFLNKVFEPFGLQVIGQAIAVMAIGTLVGVPLYKLYKFLKNPGMRYQIKMRRALISFGVVVLVVSVIMSLPLPFYVHCEFTVRSRDSVNVYVQSPGEIIEVKATPLQPVSEGQQLLILENLELQGRLMKIEADLREKTAQIKLLEARSLLGDDSVAVALATIHSEIQSLEELAGKIQERVDQLTLVAPADGTLLPYIEVGMRPDDRDSEVSGPLALFERKNQNAWLSRGMPVCAIGDPDSLEAVMQIPEERVAFVRPGLQVELKPFAFTSRTLESTLDPFSRLANRPQQAQQGAASGMAGMAAAAAAPSPTNSYFATADLGNAEGLGLKVGSTGRARIRCGNRSMASRLSRWVADTFRFQ